VVTADRYGRIVGYIWLGSHDINRERESDGHAWVYRKHMNDKSLLDDEDHAHQAKQGLWSLSHAVPPWGWRRKNNMDPFWQIVIGTALGGAILNIFWFLKQYLRESKESDEKQTMAIWSIAAGLTGIITFGITSIIGLILSLTSMRGRKHKALSVIGLTISLLTMLPWLVVMVFGE
jgi:hypothetical protein